MHLENMLNLHFMPTLKKEEADIQIPSTELHVMKNIWF